MTMPWPAGPYSTIVVDPPWPVKAPARYLASAGVNNWRPLEYPTMPLDDIYDLDIPSLAAPDCHLFLWTTGHFLPDAIAMLPHWGFRYLFPMVWHKNGGPQLPGSPCYNAEFIVYGRRGNAQFTDTSDFFAAFYARRGPHSAKPPAFYRLLERITAGPRIDLFARTPHPGFDAWGNEAGYALASKPQSQPSLF